MQHRLKPRTFSRNLFAPALWIGLSLMLAPSFSSSAPGAGPLRSVKVGVYQGAPKVFVDERGQATGLFVELLEAVAQAENWALEFVPCDWASCLGELEAGRLDLMPDVAHSPARSRRFDFHSTPVVESWSQIYARRSDFDSLVALDGKRIAVLRGSIQEAALEQMIRGFGFRVELIRTRTMEETFGRVAAGQADAAVVNHFFGDFFHAEHGLVKTPIVFQAAKLHFATARGQNPELLAAIDEQLQDWRQESNSPYYQVLARWMERPLEPIVPDYLWWILGIGLGGLLLLLGLTLLLRAEVRSRTEHLRESQDLLMTTQRLSKVGGWDWDVKKQKMVWTEETYRIHGIAAERAALDSSELIQTSLACYAEEGRELVKEAFQRCAEQGQPYDLEVPFVDLQGRAMWVRTTARAIHDDRGRVIRVVGNLMDVSERRGAEEKRKKVEERLRTAQKMEAIGQLAGGVAHDFNNLLSVILGYTEFVIAALDESDPNRRRLQEVQAAGQRAAKLTGQLLAFGRRQVMKPVVLDLNAVLGNLDGLLRKLLPENIAIDMRLAPGLGHVRADAGQLEQVVVNLAVNARDAMPEGGRLEIATLDVEGDGQGGGAHPMIPSGPFVLLTVLDSGTGMDEQTRDRIFDPFFTTKETGKGTGLGLATVYGIVKQSDGYIWVESEPGQGSRFEIYLPRVDESLTEILVGSPAPGARGEETVLVVEDDDMVRRLIEHILVRAGYKVLLASEGREALRRVEEEAREIHLLLTDVVMPEMSGPELARRVLELRPGIRVLFVSGYPNEAIAHHLEPVAGEHFLGKPFSAEELTGKVREVLAGMLK